MTLTWRRGVALPILTVLTSFATSAVADHPWGVDATISTGPDQCRAGFSPPDCTMRPFDRSMDVAYAGNGFAKPAVTKDLFTGYAIHAQAHLNDGLYGNGASWIGATADNWVKIDLGRELPVDGVRFGRDRTGAFKDRSPGAFSVWLAKTDDVYANGNDAHDATEYQKVHDDTSDVVLGAGQTIHVSFPPTSARYVKIEVKNKGTAIDEVEVSSPTACDPAASRFELPGHRCVQLVAVGAGPTALADGDSIALEIPQARAGNSATELKPLGGYLSGGTLDGGPDGTLGNPRAFALDTIFTVQRPCAKVAGQTVATEGINLQTASGRFVRITPDGSMVAQADGATCFLPSLTHLVGFGAAEQHPGSHTGTTYVPRLEGDPANPAADRPLLDWRPDWAFEPSPVVPSLEVYRVTTPLPPPPAPRPTL